MVKKLKPVPFFETEAEERHFWETHDSMDYVDWSKARRVQFPNLKMTPGLHPEREPAETVDAAESPAAD